MKVFHLNSIANHVPQHESLNVNHWNVKSMSKGKQFHFEPLIDEFFCCSGFLRSDILLGTVLIKLSDFETKCTIHECFPLTEGRKVKSGRLEVKVKLREPLLAKQIEEINEKWIVFTWLAFCYCRNFN